MFLALLSFHTIYPFSTPPLFFLIFDRILIFFNNKCAISMCYQHILSVNFSIFQYSNMIFIQSVLFLHGVFFLCCHSYRHDEIRSKWIHVYWMEKNRIVQIHVNLINLLFHILPHWHPPHCIELNKKYKKKIWNVDIHMLFFPNKSKYTIGITQFYLFAYHLWNSFSHHNSFSLSISFSILNNLYMPFWNFVIFNDFINVYIISWFSTVTEKEIRQW